MYCPSPKPAVQRLRMLDPPGSASMQVPGRGGLHGHHPGHAVQACAIPPGTLVGAQRDRGAQRRGPQGHTRPRGAQRWGVTAGETDRGTDQEVSPWVQRVHPSVPPPPAKPVSEKGAVPQGSAGHFLLRTHVGSLVPDPSVSSLWDPQFVLGHLCTRSHGLASVLVTHLSSSPAWPLSCGSRLYAPQQTPSTCGRRTPGQCQGLAGNRAHRHPLWGALICSFLSAIIVIQQNQ